MAKRRRVTAQDIADLAGVSKATVSYALNGTGSVSDEVAARIIDYANRLGYRANKLAAATRTGTTHTVGLVVPDLSYPYFPEMAQAVHKAAHDYGYAVFLVDSNQSLAMEFEGIERLIDYRVDGILWAPIRDESVKTVDSSIPTVLMDRELSGFSSVYADTYRGGQLQAEYVQELGHQEIGIVSGPSWSPHAMLRNDGIHSAIRRGTRIVWEVQKEYGVDIAQADVEKILSGGVSCVITGNDLIAIDVLQIYKSAGIEVPDDVSVIGFDDINWAGLVTPALTTVKLPKREIGKRALELLYKMIDEPGQDDTNVVLDVTLVTRDSVTPV